MKKHIYPLTLILLAIIIWIVTLPQLPVELPIHWETGGEANGFSPKHIAMLTNVGILLFIYVLFMILPKIDPRNENYKYFSRGYAFIMYVLLTIFFIMNILIILIGLGYNIPMGGLGPYVIGIIFIILGNYLQTIRSNFFIGIRTPWTISNDEVWRKTHRFAGKLFVAAGFIMILSGLFFAILASKIIFTTVIIAVGSPYVYSYFLYFKASKK